MIAVIIDEHCIEDICPGASTVKEIGGEVGEPPAVGSRRIEAVKCLACGDLLGEDGRCKARAAATHVKGGSDRRLSGVGVSTAVVVLYIQISRRR
jgi:hypothetical protein